MSSRTDRLGTLLPTLVDRLRDNGYQICLTGQSLTGSCPHVDYIRQRERGIATVPYPIAKFWRRIGSVDLRGHQVEWFGCEYPDPLVVFLASYVIFELNQFLDDREERPRCAIP